MWWVGCRSCTAVAVRVRVTIMIGVRFKVGFRVTVRIRLSDMSTARFRGKFPMNIVAVVARVVAAVLVVLVVGTIMWGESGLALWPQSRSRMRGVSPE